RHMQPCSSAACAVLREALGAPGVKITVGDQGPKEGDAYLATVGVARHDQIVAIVSHGVDHSAVRSMCDADRDVDLLAVDGPGAFREMILFQVRIVCPAEAEPCPFDLKRRASVSQVYPPCLLETSSNILPQARPQ